MRAPEPPAFRLTADDLAIIRMISHHRFLRSTQLAALVGRSPDRINKRLLRLFHAGYVDRPRAQLDYYPTAGSGPMVYALADRGARLLRELDAQKPTRSGLDRKNAAAGRPFLEHQLGIMDFYVSLERATQNRSDVRLICPAELVSNFPEKT